MKKKMTKMGLKIMSIFISRVRLNLKQLPKSTQKMIQILILITRVKLSSLKYLHHGGLTDESTL